MTTDEILNGTILTEDIGDDQITTPKIATDAVTTVEIQNETIIAEDIAVGAVTTDEILDGTVGTADLEDGGVMEDDLADDAVTEEKIMDGAVTTDKIADGAVTTDKFEDGATHGQMHWWDNSTSNWTMTTGSAPVETQVMKWVDVGGGTYEPQWADDALTLPYEDDASTGSTSLFQLTKNDDGAGVMSLVHSAAGDGLNVEVPSTNASAGSAIIAQGGGSNEPTVEIMRNTDFALENGALKVDASLSTLESASSGEVIDFSVSDDNGYDSYGLNVMSEVSGATTGDHYAGYFEISSDGNGTALHADGNSGMAIKGVASPSDPSDYIAEIERGNDGRAMYIEGASENTTGILDPADEDDAVLVVRNDMAGSVPMATAIKTYGDIWANSAIGSSTLIGIDEVIVGDPNGLHVSLTPPVSPGAPMEIDDDVDIHGDLNVDDAITASSLTLSGKGYSAETEDTDPDNTMTTKGWVEDNIGAVADEPFLTFDAANDLSDNRILTAGAGISLTDAGSDDGAYTVAIPTGGVVSSMILDGTIIEDDLADDAVTQAKLADNSVGHDEIIDGEVDNDDLNDNTVFATVDADNANPFDLTNGTHALNIVGGTNITTTSDGANTVQIDASVLTDGTTILGDGTSGNEIRLNLNNPNTWTATQTFDDVDINGGTIDGVNIGGNTPGNATFNDLTVNGTANFNGSLNANAGAVVTGTNFWGNGLYIENGMEIITADPLLGYGITIDAGGIWNLDKTDLEGKLTVNNNADINGNLAVTGTVTASSGTFSDLWVDACEVLTTCTNFDGDVQGDYQSLELTNTGVTAGTYGDPGTGMAVSFDVDEDGRITDASEAAITIGPPNITPGNPGEALVTNSSGNTAWQDLMFDGAFFSGDAVTSDLTIDPGVITSTEIDDAFVTATVDADNSSPFDLTDGTHQLNIIGGTNITTTSDGNNTVTIDASVLTDGSTILGDGTSGDEIRLNLGNPNHWTATQEFDEVDINGGEIDGTVIGANNEANGTFNDLTAEGLLDANGGAEIGNGGFDLGLRVMDGIEIMSGDPFFGWGLSVLDGGIYVLDDINVNGTLYNDIGDLTVDDNLQVNDDAQIDGDLNVDGAVTASSGTFSDLWVDACEVLTTCTTFGGDVDGTYDNIQLLEDVVTEFELNETTVAADTYGDAANLGIADFTVDEDGRLTAANEMTVGNAGGTDVNAGGNWGALDLQLQEDVVTPFELDETAVSAGTYGDIAGFDVVQFTVDEDGRLTDAQQATMAQDGASDLTMSGDFTAMDLQLKADVVTPTELDETAVTADSYGDVTGLLINDFTVDEDGRLTDANETTFADAAASDISINGGSTWGAMDWQIDNGVVGNDEINDATVFATVDADNNSPFDVTDGNPELFFVGGQNITTTANSGSVTIDASVLTDNPIVGDGTPGNEIDLDYDNSLTENSGSLTLNMNNSNSWSAQQFFGQVKMEENISTPGAVLQVNNTSGDPNPIAIKTEGDVVVGSRLRVDANVTEQIQIGEGLIGGSNDPGILMRNTTLTEVIKINAETGRGDFTTLTADEGSFASSLTKGGFDVLTKDTDFGLTVGEVTGKWNALEIQNDAVGNDEIDGSDDFYFTGGLFYNGNEVVTTGGSNTFTETVYFNPSNTADQALRAWNNSPATGDPTVFIQNQNDNGTALHVDNGNVNFLGALTVDPTNNTTPAILARGNSNVEGSPPTRNENSTALMMEDGNMIYSYVEVTTDINADLNANSGDYGWATVIDFTAAQTSLNETLPTIDNNVFIQGGGQVLYVRNASGSSFTFGGSNVIGSPVVNDGEICCFVVVNDGGTPKWMKVTE